uniref:Uncharacterized protein n=1 Tax=Prolemur simus TaxID=1328070 RepID=A0A8C9A6H3_PROSS
MSFIVAAAIDSRFPNFQELDLEPERACQDVAGTLEVDYFLFFNFGTVDLAVRKEATTEQALPPALLLGIGRPEFLSRTSVQTEGAPSKVNYAYRSHTWIFAHGDSYHLTTEEDTIPVDHCDPRDIQPL